MELIINLIAWLIVITFFQGIVAIAVLIINAINQYFKKESQGKIKETHGNMHQYPQEDTNPQWEKVILPDGTEFHKLKKNSEFDLEQHKRMNELIEMQKLPYSKKNLLTPTEYKFWTELKSVCDTKGFLICPKVRMEDFIQVNVAVYAERQKHRGKIKSRHIDFIICDNKLRLLAGIELDDWSHNKENAKRNDEFKNQVFFNLRLPLYRIKVKSSAYLGELEQIINELN